MRLTKRDKDVLTESYLGDVLNKFRGRSEDTEQTFNIFIGKSNPINVTVESVQLYPHAPHKQLDVSLKGSGGGALLRINEITEKNQYDHPDDIIKSNANRTSFPTKQDALSFISSIKKKLQQEGIDFNLVGINKLIYHRE